MKMSSLSSSFLIIMLTLSISTSLVYGTSNDKEYEATLDKNSYQNTDILHVFLSGQPYDTISLRILDHSNLEKFTDSIHLGSDGLTLYTLNMTPYMPGVYSAILNNGEKTTKLDFSVGLVPSGGYRVEMNTTKMEFYLGNSIPIKGILDVNSTIQIKLVDPTNVLEYSTTTRSDATGMFSPILHIPVNSPVGIWKIDAMDALHSRQSFILVHSNQTTVKNTNIDTKSGAYVLSGNHMRSLYDESPLKQLKSGINEKDIMCKQGLQLIIKAEDSSPACVKPDTANILIERGWAKLLQ